jgi:hypothetical protein
MSKLNVMVQFWSFLKARKRMWLLPLIVLLLALSSMIMLAQGSAIAPFIYTLF